ncbi:MAG: type transport system ATP-binding protein [Actinomycetota bacterium]|jgi:ABC-2 type transport system ATP-binding protein|nr:type transport system ATP-binding protein [Actinomycetota bacterium]
MTEKGAYPVVAENLQRRFKDVEAVRGIDLQISRGEIFGFLGPNGAGKSTTVRMLTTLLLPSGGRASVAGYDVVKEADAVRRSIGVALQDAAIDPLMTGRELIRLQAVLHGIPRSQADGKGVELLDRVGLTAAGDRRVGTYSGGMRRRLDLALALIHTPEVLFLDEPTTGLDPNSRQAIWEEVRNLNSEGTTVFLTTQYMEEADRLAGRIAIIDNGSIVAEGTPAQLKAAIGEPTLQISLPEGTDEVAAEALLMKYGDPVDTPPGSVAVRLKGGASQVATVIRGLDEANIQVESLELHNPTLDDVFHKATGRRLEGAEDATDAGPSIQVS